MKVILSTGIGRLHFVPAAEALDAAGVDIEVIQGWVPRRTPPKLIDVAGRLTGRRYLRVGLEKRRMPFLTNQALHSCPVAEVYTEVLMRASRRGLISRSNAATVGWRGFGRASKRFLNCQDIFHVRSGAGRGGAINLARDLGIKVIVDHSIAHPAYLESSMRRAFEAAGLPFWFGPQDPFWRSVIQDCEDADLVLVNSDLVKETFVAAGFDPDKIAVVYLGVRSDFGGIKNSYRTSGGLKLLFTGSFGIRKGATYLLEALDILDRQGIPFTMTVVGDAHEAKPLAEKYSWSSEKMRFMGFLPQESLKGFLKDSDIYLFPSLAEGCASSGMEALAAGLPVIATKGSGLPIRDGENGVIVPEHDPDAIAGAIMSLSSDEEKRTEIGLAAAKEIAARYRWSDYAAGVVKAYQTVLF